MLEKIHIIGKLLGGRPDFEISAPDYATDEELRSTSIAGLSGVDVELEQPEPRPPVPPRADPANGRGG